MSLHDTEELRVQKLRLQKALREFHAPYLALDRVCITEARLYGE